MCIVCNLVEVRCTWNSKHGLSWHPYCVDRSTQRDSPTLVKTHSTIFVEDFVMNTNAYNKFEPTGFPSFDEMCASYKASCAQQSKLETVVVADACGDSSKPLKEVFEEGNSYFAFFYLNFSDGSYFLEVIKSNRLDYNRHKFDGLLRATFKAVAILDIGRSQYLKSPRSPEEKKRCEELFANATGADLYENSMFVSRHKVPYLRIAEAQKKFLVTHDAATTFGFLKTL